MQKDTYLINIFREKYIGLLHDKKKEGRIDLTDDEIDKLIMYFQTDDDGIPKPSPSKEYEKIPDDIKLEVSVLWDAIISRL